MKIYIPSYNRANQVLSAEYFKGLDYRIVIPEKQYKNYLQYHDRKELLVIPDNRDGNVSKKRNAILDVMKEKEGFGIVADDDILYVAHVMTGEKLDGKRVANLFENMFVICEGIGAYFCGLNNSNDKLKYRGDMHPFSLTKSFYQLVGIIESGIRYDETLVRGEDIDFYLKQMHKYHKVVRDNRYFVCVNEKNKDTGIGIDDKGRINDFKRLQKRWGSRLIRLNDDGTVKGVSHPYKGV
jgi:hypothetical protein